MTNTKKASLKEDIKGKVDDAKKEIAKVREASTPKKKLKSTEPFSKRVWGFVKRWGIRLFETAFLLLFIYVFLATFIGFIPLALGYILGSTGFTLETMDQVLLAFFAGGFFTAWMFVISKFFITKACKIYIRCIKRTVPEEAQERLEKLIK